MEQFQQKKDTALGKRDKSNAGRIDPKAVDICAAINSSPRYYTTSSCAGRCFIYTGDGIKSHHHYLTTNPNNNNDDNGDDTSNRHGFFQRYRVNHDLVRDPQRYFNLNTISTDLSGGGDPVRETNQFEGKTIHNNNNQKNEEKEESTTTSTSSSQVPKYYADSQNASQKSKNKTLWLRFEPFILHVCCFNQNDANRLMNAARPAFKNVGLTSIQKNIVAIWGDEGLDMPLSVPASSNNMNDDTEYGKFLFESNEEKEWLQSLVNERHVRNWQKIDRFTQHVHEMLLKNDDDELDIGENESTDNKTTKHRRSYDVIGDVAIIVASNDDNGIVTQDMIKFGEAILKKNKHIKVVLARTKPLSGTDRSPSGGNSSESSPSASSSSSSSSSSGLEIVCGGPPERLLSLTQKNTFITSHTEYGIKCVVDLQHLFFSPRMASERLRICQQIARSERICVLFCGVGMEVLQIAGRNEIKSMLAVDLNERAIRCLERGKRMLERNKSLGKDSKEKADKIEIVHGDVLDVLKERSESKNEAFVKFDRILAPRPKEVTSSIESSSTMDTNHDDGTPAALKNKIVDGDLGDGSGGLKYLRAIMSVLKEDGGECHWYDFCADWEIHNDNGKGRCERTCQQILMVAKEQQLRVEILHIAKVGSVAKRQFRVCVDFRLNGRDDGK